MLEQVVEASALAGPLTSAQYDGSFPALAVALCVAPCDAVSRLIPQLAGSLAAELAAHARRGGRSPRTLVLSLHAGELVTCKTESLVAPVLWPIPTPIRKGPDSCAHFPVQTFCPGFECGK